MIKVHDRVKQLKTEISYKDDLLEKNSEILTLQRMYIVELEENYEKIKNLFQFLDFLDR